MRRVVHRVSPLVRCTPVDVGDDLINVLWAAINVLFRPELRWRLFLGIKN